MKAQKPYFFLLINFFSVVQVPKHICKTCDAPFWKILGQNKNISFGIHIQAESVSEKNTFRIQNTVWDKFILKNLPVFHQMSVPGSANLVLRCQS
jgi:hypothetical protein